MGNYGILFLDVLFVEVYDFWKCEFFSDGGFLLGDFFILFVLIVEILNFGIWFFGLRINESIFLRSNFCCFYIVMCDVNVLLEIIKLNVLVDVVFFLDGEIFYCVMIGGGDNGKFVVCNVLNGEFIVEKFISYKISDCFVVVKEGVLFLICKGVFELWNFNLLLCI